MCKDKLVWLTLKAVILSEVEPVLINQWADWDALVHIIWFIFISQIFLNKLVLVHENGHFSFSIGKCFSR